MYYMAFEIGLSVNIKVSKRTHTAGVYVKALLSTKSKSVVEDVSLLVLEMAYNYVEDVLVVYLIGG